jgi:hypothetical protein
MARIIPIVLNVRNEARNEDEIDGAFAEDLIGDVNVATLGISGLGLHQFASRGWLM